MSLVETASAPIRRAELQPDIPAEGHARVLIACNDSGEASAMARVLRTGPSVNVELADDWEGLTALLNIAVYDVVIVAEGFSGVTGIEAKKRIESLYRDPPAAILAGPDDLRVAVKAFRCGFADYLTGDVRTGQVLREAVQRATRSVKRRREESLHVKYLERMAQRDGQTGLPNRQAIEERIEQLSQIKARYSHPFGVVLVRLKGFDSICDTFGFRVGDQCLLSFGKRLADASRKSDLVARWDITDFAYLIDRDVSVAGLKAACERLAKAMTFSMNIDEVGVAIGAEVGWAMFPEDGHSAEELLACSIGRFDGGDEETLAGAELKGVSAGGEQAADTVTAPIDAPERANDAAPGGIEWRLEETTEAVANPMAGDDRTSNRRTAQRRRTFKRGVLVFNDGFSTVNCIIRDMSSGGVRVSIEGQFIAPDSMELKMESDRRRPVELRWQRDNQLGLMFLDLTVPVASVSAED